MSDKSQIKLAFCILAWIACTAFVVAATYIHYAMDKDVTPLIFGAIISGGSGYWLLNELTES
jgi:uncharacterized protein (UPF0333 family)